LRKPSDRITTSGAAGVKGTTTMNAAARAGFAASVAGEREAANFVAVALAVADSRAAGRVATIAVEIEMTDSGARRVPSAIETAAVAMFPRWISTNGRRAL
jgi:hypothetical protein